MVLNQSNPYDEAKKEISELENRLTELELDQNILDQTLKVIKQDILNAKAKIDINYNNAENTPTFTIGNMSVGVIPRSSDSGALAFELAPIEISPEPFIEIAQDSFTVDGDSQDAVNKISKCIIDTFIELIDDKKFKELLSQKLIS
nr:MAG TPA: hypothetical protein [Bacteriophage sp.]